MRQFLKNNGIEFFALTVLVIGGIVMLVSLTYLILLYTSSTPVLPARFVVQGYIGSFLSGTVGTLFSLAYSIFVYNALKLQQNELKETRLTFESQQFESTFFKLLEFQENIKQRIFEKSKSWNPDSEANAALEPSDVLNTSTDLPDLYHAFTRDCAYYSKDSIQKAYDKNQVSLHKTHYISVEDFAINELAFDIHLFESTLGLKTWIYIHFYEKFREYIGHYFRNLYHILKLIRENEKAYLLNNPRSNKTKIYLKHKQYADITQAQMSSYELCLYFYNCLIFPKSKALVHYYKFFDNLYIQDLSSEEDAKFYSEPSPIHGIELSPMKLRSRTQDYA